jgi:GNAT superfamily N-acetyltransferase
VDRDQTLKFARALLMEVWESFDSSAVARFYHRDVVGHHRRPNETQELGYADVVNRLDWDGPEVTKERYKEFMCESGCESELDLVAEAPDGGFGAYCICRLDHANGVGLLEPVGTRPGFRRRGLARTVVLEGLRRMEARGARTALVCLEGDNEPARGLYESVGFGLRSTIYTYTKGA